MVTAPRVPMASPLANKSPAPVAVIVPSAFTVARRSRMTHARLPASTLEVLDGIGHVPQLEAPLAVARLVERHLAKVVPR